MKRPVYAISLQYFLVEYKCGCVKYTFAFRFDDDN